MSEIFEKRQKNLGYMAGMGDSQGSRGHAPIRARGNRRWPGQCAPHSLFGLAKKRMGRARSKRKKRFGGSVRAERVPPAAGEGWLAFPRFGLDETRYPWGNLRPGEGPDTPYFSFRWRCPGILPGFLLALAGRLTRADEGVGPYGAVLGSACVPARSPSSRPPP